MQEKSSPRFIIILICVITPAVLTTTDELIVDFEQATCLPWMCEITIKELKITKPDTRVELYDKERSLDIDVQIFIENSICKYFPRGFEKHFTRVLTISVKNSKLRTITRRDLQPFTLLQTLKLEGNLLISLEPRLFAFNPQMRVADFSHNRIRTIAADIYDHIQTEARIELIGNACIDTETASLEIYQVTALIITNCQISASQVDDTCSKMYSEWVLKEMSQEWIENQTGMRVDSIGSILLDVFVICFVCGILTYFKCAIRRIANLGS